MTHVRGNPNKLQPVQSKQEASEKGRKGGLASGIARREKKTLRQRLELLLARKVDDMDTADALSIALIEKALSGDVRAYEVIRDTIGEKPTDKVDASLSGSLVIKWQE